MCVWLGSVSLLVAWGAGCPTLLQWRIDTCHWVLLLLSCCFIVLPVLFCFIVLMLLGFVFFFHFYSVRGPWLYWKAPQIRCISSSKTILSCIDHFYFLQNMRYPFIQKTNIQHDFLNWTLMCFECFCFFLSSVFLTHCHPFGCMYTNNWTSKWPNHNKIQWLVSKAKREKEIISDAKLLKWKNPKHKTEQWGAVKCFITIAMNSF